MSTKGLEAVDVSQKLKVKELPIDSCNTT